jgi:glycerol-3-phosphate acyltransferase PlsY
VVAFNWAILGELWALVAFAAAMCALIILRHRGNIRRLIAGTENKVGR